MTKWITTKDFINREKISNIFYSENNQENDVASDIENYHALFRKTFDISKESGEKYTLKITADDIYKLYINGKFVSQGPASGYIEHYNYNVYDVTDFIKDKKNILAVHTYYHGRIDNTHLSADYRQGIWCEFYVDDTLLFASDESFKYYIDKSYISNGKTWGYNTQFYENIDRRIHPHGWREILFDDSSWENAISDINDDHILTKQITDSVISYEVFPREIKKLGDKNYLLDFGREICANVKINAIANEGDTVRIMCAEELKDDGHARYEMRCTMTYDETWTLANGKNEFESFDYSGFRYIEIETSTDNITGENISAIERHYPAGKMKECHLNNELLKDIWKICAEAVKISTQESHFDCITREKGAYLGDMLITGMSFYYLTGDTTVMKKSLYDFKHSQEVVHKGIPAFSCASRIHFIPDYSMLFTEVLYNYYRISNDLETLRDMVCVFETMIDDFEKKYQGEDLLLSGVDGMNLVDWPKNLRDDYDFDLENAEKLGPHNAMNAYYYGALVYANKIYKELNIDKRYDSEAVKQAYINAFYNKEKGLFNDSTVSTHNALHSNVLPLYYNITDTREDIERIVELIKEKGFSCGVYFSYFILKALCENGYKEEAMKLMLNKSEHSWYNMLKEGATTCFEAWGKEQKWNTSLCHPWASSPIIILTEYF